MKKIIPAVAIAALFAASAAIAQTTAPTAPSPTAPSAQPSTGAQPGTTTTTPGVGATTPGTTTGASGTSAAATGDASSMTMTEAEAKNWVDKAVYGSDNKSVGEVAAVQRDASGKVTELHADVGGFLGIGESRVRLMPAQFTLSGDRVILNVTSDAVKDLPKIAK